MDFNQKPKVSKIDKTVTDDEGFVALPKVECLDYHPSGQRLTVALRDTVYFMDTPSAK